MAPAIDNLPVWDLPEPSPSPEPAESILWQRFTHESVRWRIPKDKYKNLAKELICEERIPSPLLVQYVLGGQIDGDITADPLICDHVEVLLDIDLFDLAQLLEGTYLRSSRRIPPVRDGSSRNCPDMDTKMIFMAATRIISGKGPNSLQEARGILDVLPAWLAAVVGSHSAVSVLDHQFGLWIESVGVLAIAMLENQRFIEIIDHAWNGSESLMLRRAALISNRRTQAAVGRDKRISTSVDPAAVYASGAAVVGRTAGHRVQISCDSARQGPPAVRDQSGSRRCPRDRGNPEPSHRPCQSVDVHLPEFVGMYPSPNELI
jgi:hypothetical protein